MARITQNEQMPYFHCAPYKFRNNMKSKKGLSKSFKDNATACKQL